MENYYWTLESWGSDYAPENADEIIEQANSLIDSYAETHDEDETAAYSERLWELYCSTGRLYKWDLRINSNGNAEPMSPGFHEKTTKISFCEWDPDDFVIVGKYRIAKADLNDQAVRRFLHAARMQGKLY